MPPNPPPQRLEGSRRRRPVDVVAAGELLLDLISTDFADGFDATRTFTGHPGGSAANLAATCARLGNRAVLAAAVGRDGVGRRLRREVAAAGVDVERIALRPAAPTTALLLTRTRDHASFLAWRGADALIHPGQLPADLLDRATVFHTTCFALSREPARGSIMDAARRAAGRGGQVSLELNYAPAVGPERGEARRVVAELCRHGAMIKASLDDVRRLFPEHEEPERAVDRLHDHGASLVCLTRGAEDVLVSWAGGDEQARVSPPAVPVADSTGAGDAFWAGFLTAWLDGHAPPRCARAGARVAARKVQVVGPLRERIARDALYTEPSPPAPKE